MNRFSRLLDRFRDSNIEITLLMALMLFLGNIAIQVESEDVMPNIPQMQIGETVYKIKDQQARFTLDCVTEKSEKNKWINPVYDANGIVLTQNKDGSVHLSGTPTIETLYIDAFYSSPLAQKTYTISCKKTGNTSGVSRFLLAVRNADNTGTQFLQFNSGMTEGHLVVNNFAPAKCEIIVFSDTTYNCDLYIQLEEGNKATSYTPSLTAVDFTARQAIEDVNDSIINGNALLLPIKNYKNAVEITSESLVTKWGNSAGVINHSDKNVQIQTSTAVGCGFMTEPFLFSEMASTDFRISCSLSIVSGSARVYLYGKAKTTGDDLAYLVNYYPTSIDEAEINLDGAYIAVYTNLDTSNPISVLVTNGGNEISNIVVSNLRVDSKVLSSSFISDYGEESLGDALKKINEHNSGNTGNNKTYYYSPNGTKYMFGVANDGTMRGIKAIPSKAVFIGNSLLAGWSTFGMAATDIDHDYYHYVTEKIAELSPSCTFNRLSNGNLEHATTNDTFETAWDEISEYLTSDVELICIQLGDNVNTPAKVSQFEGTSFYTMVNWIHTNCPDARLVWVGSWYQSIHDWLKEACWANGVEFIDIFDLSVAENKSKLGDLIHRTSDVIQTLTGTYQISGSSLVVDVYLGGSTRTITVPTYTTVVDNGNGTFTMTAPYTIVDSSGVASHPNDAGMLAIANRICKELDYIFQDGDITE